jgi:hypothetical protein
MGNAVSIPPPSTNRLEERNAYERFISPLRDQLFTFYENGDNYEEVPLNESGDSPLKKGNIRYLYNRPIAEIKPNVKGLFSLTYYYRANVRQSNRNVEYGKQFDKINMYRQGLNAYVTIVSLNKIFKVFKDFYVVLYTDLDTIASLLTIEDEVHILRDIFKHPKVILGVCSWPEFSPFYAPPGLTIVGRQPTAPTTEEESGTAAAKPQAPKSIDPPDENDRTDIQWKKVDGILLCMMRFRSFVDFQKIPIFVRDADTYFDTTLSEFPILLGNWEQTLYANHQREHDARNLPMLLASTPSYKKPWHKNLRLMVAENVGHAYAGYLAGMVNTLGGIPEWESGCLWEKCIQFVRERYAIMLKGKYQT